MVKFFGKVFVLRADRKSSYFSSTAARSNAYSLPDYLKGDNILIRSKKELVEYLKADKEALGIKKKFPMPFKDEIWRFERLLRYTEYMVNVKQGWISRIFLIFYKTRFHHLSVRLGFSIPLNVFGKGLSIAHYGTIVVNEKAKIGEFCRIQENVTIGATSGSEKAPKIGDRVFIGSGAKIIGDITIEDDIAIGAGSVVVKSVDEPHITIAGVPARKISNKGSKCFLITGDGSEKSQHFRIS